MRDAGPQAAPIHIFERRFRGVGGKMELLAAVELNIGRFSEEISPGDNLSTATPMLPEVFAFLRYDRRAGRCGQK